MSDEAASEFLVVADYSIIYSKHMHDAPLP
jgi:hypothetical protein